ncbi:hypothetical protein J32TS6_33810 [Virgibacillus pantothenticus]|nr:hypothetical protein J32TS6_33810 [Virgibacillus pantothenticus]SIT00235.1 hypothetical protein SAMN05421787_109158 [Virgibacillus pantothenticus]
MLLRELMIPIIISLSVCILFTVFFKGKGKVDKGCKFNYFRLSYRQKMIRTIILFPIVILAMIFIYYFSDFSIIENIILGLLFSILFAGQLLYNYLMWKKNEAP